jgi:hypothetical protein
MESGNQFYFVLYSCSQGYFHVENAAIMAENNLQSLVRGVADDYIVLAICSSLTEAHEKSVELQLLREESPLWPEAATIFGI